MARTRAGKLSQTLKAKELKHTCKRSKRHSAWQQCFFQRFSQGAAAAPSLPPAPSPYTGTYTGKFTAASGQGSDTGTISAVVAPGGGITGTVVDNTTQTQAALTGSVGSSGQLHLVYAYPNVTATSDGQAVQAASGHLTATVPEVIGGQTVAQVMLDLVRQ